MKQHVLRYAIYFLFLGGSLVLQGQQQALTIAKLPEIGENDTIAVPIVLTDEGWRIYLSLPEVLVRTRITKEQYIAYLRLQQAVYRVYPYAKDAAKIVLGVQHTLDSLPTKRERRRYLRQRAKDLKTLFTAPLKKLSMYQGSVLIKLINRETGNTCYELIKEYRGGLTATVWQVVAGFFKNTLKATYDPETDEQDAEIEKLIREIEQTRRF